MTPRNKLASDDKRSRTDLELFLLALASHEISTPYQFLTVAGLSVGATVPALRRLEEAGYVRRGKPGTRGRIQYEITASGRRHLKSGWRPLLGAQIPADIGAILRTAALALLSGADRKSIATYMGRAAASKTADSKRRKDPNSVGTSFSTGDAGLYRWMLAAHASERLATEAKVLRRFATSIARRSWPSL